MAQFTRFSCSLLQKSVFTGTRLVSRSSRVTSKRLFHRTHGVLVPGVLKEGENPLKVSNAEWEKRLTQEQFFVCREQGTEEPFTGEYVNHNDPGAYSCVCCGAALFSSEAKYVSGAGWPCFWQASGTHGKDESATNVLRRSDNLYGMISTEVICKKCDSHLGHVFDDGPQPSGHRFCINSTALRFAADEPDQREQSG